MAQLKALGGTSDILPGEVEGWQRLESTARQVMALYGMREIRTPLLEEAEVFTRSLGEAAEIVTKQMYRFEDRGGRTVTLRPEGTASIVRALIEHGLDKSGGLQRFYYLGPMFRAERPQAGRRRQFHQIGVEVFGTDSPHQDVEVIALLVRLLAAWGVSVAKVAGDSGAVLVLNNLGCREDRPRLLKQLKTYFLEHDGGLCADCKERLGSNPLRILDCKKERCHTLAKGSMTSAWICDACRRHFDQVLKGLGKLGIRYEHDRHLVRGLDYYTRTAFEVIYPGLGAQNALGGGGRYDDLVRQMGGAEVPAVGFAVGLERVLLALGKGAGSDGPASSGGPVFVATLCAEEIPEGLERAEALRARGIPSVAGLEPRPLRKQLDQANRLGCRWVVLRGQQERAEGKVAVKNMESGEQSAVEEARWLEWLQDRLKS